MAKANFILFLVTKVTVLATINCNLETKRNLSVNQVLADDVSGSKWTEGIPIEESLHSNVKNTSATSSLDKHMSNIEFANGAALNAKEMVIYKYIRQRMKGLVNESTDKRGSGRNTNTASYKIISPLSGGSGLRSKGNTEARNSPAKVTKEHSFDTNTNFMRKIVFPFQVAVVVTKPKGPNRNAVILVPLTVDMTVLDAFMAATRKYRDETTTKVDDIPFNVVLDWDKRLQCYVVIKAVGIENTRKQAWFFTVRDFMYKKQYRGRCLPDDDVILRPLSSVQLTFKQLKRRLN